MVPKPGERRRHKDQTDEVRAPSQTGVARPFFGSLAGTKFESIADLLKGPTGIAYSKDPVAAAKVCSKFAKDNSKLTILGGNLDGQTMDVAGVETLAKLPSLLELRARLAGLMQAPA